MDYATITKNFNTNLLLNVVQAVESEVAPMLKDKVAESAHKNVLGGRSYQDGSIADADNVISDVELSGNNVTVTIKDVAIPEEPIYGGYAAFQPDTDTKFAEWIEYGEWMDLKNYINSGFTDKSKRPARPFIEPVRNELESDPDIIMNAILKGLK